MRITRVSVNGRPSRNGNARLVLAACGLLFAVALLVGVALYRPASEATIVPPMHSTNLVPIPAGGRGPVAPPVIKSQQELEDAAIVKRIFGKPGESITFDSLTTPLVQPGQ